VTSQAAISSSQFSGKFQATLSEEKTNFPRFKKKINHTTRFPVSKCVIFAYKVLEENFVS
jgi:hypothetical protein